MQHPKAWTAQTRIATPLGPMTAVATVRGLAGLWFDDQRHHPGAIDVPQRDDAAPFGALRVQLGEYFAGRRRAFALPLDPQGTPFQQRVWAALGAIDAGRTTGYGAIALGLGAPQACRAVGAAVGRNPVSIVIPCHRVLGSDGSLTGYAGGLERKQRLLELEGVLDGAPAMARRAA